MASTHSSSDILNVLIATDIHLGYGEDDPIRSKDSINTFEEILQIAQDKKVDFILLGGDLFHENKPSRYVMHECVRLLRQFCMSNRPVKFDLVSDTSLNFPHSIFTHANYQDENLNIGIPIFTINGNHDDVTGKNLCALDVLHEAGLLNYFGKYSSVEEISVSPILLKKGSTRVALFGLGAVRDERLHRLFLAQKVKFMTLSDKKAVNDDWFNLFVLHQNRVRHGLTNYIPESMLPSFFDLVVWGHEHPCLIDPTPSAVNDFFIMQPGSSVATALSEGEAGNKYVAVLKICGKDFKTEKIQLKTVRPFLFQHINMANTNVKSGTRNTVDELEMYCKEKIDEMIQQAEQLHTDSCKQPKEPLIRLSIDLWHDSNETFNVGRFGQQFVNRVANPRDLILFHRHRESKARHTVDLNVMRQLAENRQELSSRVEDYVVKYFSEVDPEKQMVVLTEKGMAEALRHFVDKEEKDAIHTLFKHQLDRCKNRLKKEELENFKEDEVVAMLDEIHKLRAQRDKKSLIEEDQRDIDAALNEASDLRAKSSAASNGATRQHSDTSDNDVTMASDDDDVSLVAASAPKRGRGSRGRAAKNGTPDDRSAARARGRARGRGSRGGSKRGNASIMDFM